MNKICTSIEQSERLIGLGLDVNTADMYNVPYFGSDECRYCISQPMTGPNCSTAWSLTALLELMPNDTTLLHYDNVYSMVYDKKPYYVTKKYNNSLDAAFEIVCWLLENKKL